jgi:hypothetical protein
MKHGLSVHGAALCVILTSLFGQSPCLAQQQLSPSSESPDVRLDRGPQKNPFFNNSIHPPFDASVLQEKVIALATMHNGYIEKEAVEKIFGVTLKTWMVYGDAGYSDTAYGSSPWFTHVGYSHFVRRYVVRDSVLNSGGVLSRLSIGWGYFPDEKDLCLPPLELRSKLMALGWQDEPQSPIDPRFAEFANTNNLRLKNPVSGSHLEIGYAGNGSSLASVAPANACVLAVDIEGRK